MAVQEYDCRCLWEGSPQIYGDECLDLCDGDRVKYISLKIKKFKEILFLKKVNILIGDYESSNETDSSIMSIPTPAIFHPSVQ